MRMIYHSGMLFAIASICFLGTVCANDLDSLWLFPPEYEGERTISGLERTLFWFEKGEISESEFIAVYPLSAGSHKNLVTPYLFIAAVLHETDPDRLKRLESFLTRIAHWNPPRKVPVGVDWPDLLEKAPMLATMNYIAVYERDESGKLVSRGGQGSFLESQLYQGNFPGRRELTYGKLAKEGLERLRKRLGTAHSQSQEAKEQGSL